MSLHTLEEFKGIMANVGFKDVEVFEDYVEGWFCAIGKKTDRSIILLPQSIDEQYDEIFYMNPVRAYRSKLIDKAFSL